eukprot:CAMPEP_0181445878 /NCGR_PEP_ID=MMETSP1110-20121109/25814_1 /TAXON_ID=174948 /ORGANISM="Symbiodinium sp., Strain CCMP421" /LENGTH=168 /DNA_ID=CAMNT_0023569935 /DNA_START=242 /DNA_END=746 /DNA_ORIENTATION=+
MPWNPAAAEEVGAVVVLPNTLGANAQLGHGLDAIADHRPSIPVHAPLHHALIVVDEQSAWGEVSEILMVLHRHLVQSEVKGCCQSVCRAAAKVSLLEDGEATVQGSQVNDLFVSLGFPLDMAGRAYRVEDHVVITMVRQVRVPPELHVCAQGQRQQARMFLHICSPKL